MAAQPSNKPLCETRSLSLGDIMPLLREQLACGRSVEFSPHGVSMLPMLREGRDSVILSAVSGRLKKYDIPLYQRADGAYVLHRIVRVEKDSYTCIGDNQFVYEQGVTDAQIVAVLTAYRKDGKYKSINTLAYRFYCRMRQASRPLRHFVYRAKRKCKRILRRLFSRKNKE